MSGLLRGIIFVAFMLAFVCAAYAAQTRTLHIGTSSVPLFLDKKSSPALAVQIENTVWYGFLASGTAPGRLVTEMPSGERYHLRSPDCEAGTFSTSGSIPCQPCGQGHFCTGGSHRAACTGGACACDGTDHASNPVVPVHCLTNRMLTLAELQSANIAATSFADWQEVRCITAHACHRGTATTPTATNTCAIGTIGPGTYLFTTRHTNGGASGTRDSFSNTLGTSVSSANIAIFDRQVGYNILHAEGTYFNFVDTNRSNFISWTIRSPNAPNFNANLNATNVSGLNQIGAATLCIFRLK